MTSCLFTEGMASVKGGEKVYHCGGGIVYHRHDEKGLAGWDRSAGRVVDRITIPGRRRSAGCATVAVAVHLQDVVGEPVKQAPVTEPNTSVQSSKGRLVVTRTEPRS